MTVKFAQHALTPSTVEKLSTVSPDAQRDWRRLGFLENYGASEAGRWKYSVRDAVAFWIASRLIETGFDRHIACLCGWSAAPEVCVLMQGKTPFYRYIVHLHQACDGLGLLGTSAVNLKSLDELSAHEFDRADVIDLGRIASAAPVGLKEIAADVEDA